jgi:hypothetical protein
MRCAPIGANCNGTTKRPDSIGDWERSIISVKQILEQDRPDHPKIPSKIGRIFNG